MMTGLIGCILLVLAIVHAFIPHGLLISAFYGLGSILAFVTCKRDIGMNVARVLAIATTALMFFYFAGFFRMALRFNDNWYQSGAALDAIGLLFSAFAMIAVLSEYSCRLKADCEERRAKRRSFFGVPQHIDRTTS
jgi:phosphatidylglycerophosphate synthase